MKVYVLGIFFIIAVTFLDASASDNSKIQGLLHENFYFFDDFYRNHSTVLRNNIILNSDTDYSGAVSSLTLFIGGIADKYVEYGYGPTGSIAYSKHIFDINAEDHAISGYFGYNERENIVTA